MNYLGHLAELHFLLRLSVLMALSLPVLAQGQTSVSVTPAFGAVYVPEAWTLLRVDIVNSGSSDVSGMIFCAVAGEAGPVRYERPVHVPSRARVIESLLVRLPEKPPTTEPAAPAAVIILQSDAGAELGRANLVASAVGPTATTPAYLHGRTPRLLLLVGRGHAEGTGDENALCGLLSEVARRPVVPTRVAAGQLPRHAAGYDSCAVLWLSDCDADELDEAQRQALRAFVRGGGVILIAAPKPDEPMLKSWLAQWIPVRVTGTREANESSSSRLPRNFFASRDESHVSEASILHGEIVLADAGLVHAAYQQVGMGRVIFTSFSPADADLKSPVLIETLRSLWPVQAQTTVDAAEAMALGAGDVIPDLIGQRTLAWKWATVWAGGYLALASLAHLGWRGARRPMAIALATALGLLLSVGLLLGGRSRPSGEDPIHSGVLTAMALSPGGSRQFDTVAILTPDAQPTGLSVDALDSSFYPLQVDPRELATVRVTPFESAAIPTDSGSIRSIWTARAMPGTTLDVLSTMSVDEQGLRVTVQNNAGGMLRDAVLAWDRGRVWKLGDLRPGEMVIRCDRTNLNLPGEFLASSGFVSDRSRLHAASVRQALGKNKVGAALSPLLLAWSEPRDVPPSILDASSTRRIEAARMAAICASPALTVIPGKIHLDESLLEVHAPAGSALPYDFESRMWSSTAEEGGWLFALRPPTQLGAARWSEMFIEVDIVAPKHIVTLERRSPDAEKTAPDGIQSSPLLRISNTFGSRSLRLSLAPGDVGADGAIWFWLNVEGSAASAEDQARSPWHLVKFRCELDGQIAAP